ncbi:MAG: alanine racemase [Treponema sp.]|nr:alanine racemase [Treponema sp.]
MRCTKAIIYTENLKNNISEIKKNLKPGVKLCCAVKANGYGNDAINSARTAEEMGASYLAIATVSEGIELRDAGIKTELLLLSPCCPEEFKDLLENSITPLVFDQEVICELNRTASILKKKKCPVFLAVDTGMGRIGCYPEEAACLAKKIAETENLELKGMITHFAVSDGISQENKAFTAKQFDSFISAIENVRNAGIDPGIRTCAASAAGIAMSEYQLDMIRPGIILYGYYADEVTKEYLESSGIKLNLKPVMQFETEVAAIRHFKPGQTVSYGRTWKTDKETDIAVLPVGYADGLLRRNSPGLKVSINGKAYPVVGRICMDQCMVDIGKDNPDVKRWDKAIIFGPKDKGSVFDADDIAKMTGTISYEVMTSVSSRVKRIIQK